MTSKETDNSLHAADLIYGYYAGKLSPLEHAELDAMLLADLSLKHTFDAFNDNAEVRADLALMNSFDPEQSISNFHNSYYSAPKAIRLWPRIAAVAAAIAFIVMGIYFLTAPRPELVSGSSLAQDVAPGKIGATLTLASGKTIRLADVANGELANESGISINKTTDGQLVYEIKDSDTDPDKINRLSTAKGETYVLTLPDKSKVWLNAASSLTYSANLVKNGQRRVKLTGEGYFQVAKDRKHPFIVESKGQEVEVLGTHFNVNAYADEKAIKTTLVEGSVKVVSVKREILVLKPGQQSVLIDETIKVQDANIEEATAWKDGFFRFNNENIESVMRKISRWYNVEVVFDTEIPAEGLFGKVSRNKNISQVLKVLEATSLVHFKVEGRRILVTK